MPDAVGFPLINSHRQRLINGETQIVRAYQTDLAVSDPAVYLDLPTVGLPQIDGGLEGFPGFKVVSVDISPFAGRSDKSVVSYVYSNRPNAGGVATTANQPPGESVFALNPIDATEGAPEVTVYPQVVPVRDSDNPDADPADVLSIGYEIGSAPFEREAARVTYTITDTPAALGIPSGVDIGSIDGIVEQKNTLHLINGRLMLFRIAQVRTVRRGFAGEAAGVGDRVAITYEWVYDRGFTFDSIAVVGSGLEVEPSVGPAASLEAVPNSIGQVRQDADGNRLAAVLLPWLRAPAELRQYLPNEPTNYVLPPFCDVTIGADRREDLTVPEFRARARYRRIEPDGWTTLPGLAGP